MMTFQDAETDFKPIIIIIIIMLSWKLSEIANRNKKERYPLISIHRY